MAEAATGIFGIGRLGEALAGAVLSRPGQERLYVTKRGAERVERLCASDARVMPREPEEILRACDTVVIAMRPAAARSLLASLSFEPRHRVISVMAEIGLEELRRLTAGAGSASRLLALPSVAQGGQPLPVYPASDAVSRLFGEGNDLMPAGSERELMALWAITGLLSSVLKIGDIAARWLENAGIETSQAEAYARTMFSEVLDLTEAGFEQGLHEVSTPGGLNMMASEYLLRAGLARHIDGGLDLIHQRLMKTIDGA